jgi:WD40 repeat protein
MSFYWKAEEAWSKPIEVPNVPSFESWAYSPDGKKFAIASGIFVNGRVYVYDLQTGQPILSLTVPEGASGVAFDDALDLYVSSRALHLIRKYDVKKGKFADQQEIVPALLGPLGWDPLHQRLFVPTIKGEIKLLEQFGPSK